MENIKWPFNKALEQTLVLSWFLQRVGMDEDEASPGRQEHIPSLQPGGLRPTNAAQLGVILP